MLAWYLNGPPAVCLHCRQPFSREGMHVRALRTPDGYSCAEECAHDHREAGEQVG